MFLPPKEGLVRLESDEMLSLWNDSLGSMFGTTLSV